MADTATLTHSSQPTKEAKGRREIGGSMEYVDSEDVITAAENIIRQGAQVATEISSAGTDLLKNIIGISESAPRTTEDESTGEQKLVIGGQHEIKFVVEHYAKIDQSVARVSQDQIQKVAKDLERISGGEFGILDAATEGQLNETKPDLNSAGIQEISINTAFLKWNERNQKLELVKNPKPDVAAAANLSASFEMGENELQKGTENFGHFTKAIG